MVTQVTFDSQYGALFGIVANNSDLDVTITATVDDGIISVGDEVTVTGLGASVSTDSQISEGGTATYLGTGTFNGITGFVFTDDGALAGADSVLVLTNEASSDFSTLVDISIFASNTNSQTLNADPACFAAGTMLSTPGGSVAVEELSIGDLVLTDSGQTVPVKWVGRQRISTRLGAEKRVMPVRVQAGALGHGLPEQDLVLTADHGLMIDGLLINAGALVNTTTIDYVPRAEMPDGYIVYHVETENHDVILANGTPAETFIDYSDRKSFDNYAEYVDLYGAERIIAELPMPRISSRRQLPADLRARFGITAFSDDVTDEDTALIASRSAA